MGEKMIYQYKRRFFAIHQKSVECKYRFNLNTSNTNYTNEHQIQEADFFVHVNIDFFTLIKTIRRCMPLCIRVLLKCSTTSIGKQKKWNERQEKTHSSYKEIDDLLKHLFLISKFEHPLSKRAVHENCQNSHANTYRNLWHCGIFWDAHACAGTQNNGKTTFSHKSFFSLMNAIKEWSTSHNLVSVKCTVETKPRDKFISTVNAFEWWV